MVRHTLSYKGPRGHFAGVYYKRNGEWVPGVKDMVTGKRTYDVSVRDSGCAAEAAMRLAKKAAGNGAEAVLD